MRVSSVDLSRIGTALGTWPARKAHIPAVGSWWTCNRDEQRMIRTIAGAVALIGLAVEERGERDGRDVMVVVDLDQIAACVFAANVDG